MKTNRRGKTDRMEDQNLNIMRYAAVIKLSAPLRLRPPPLPPAPSSPPPGRATLQQSAGLPTSVFTSSVRTPGRREPRVTAKVECNFAYLQKLDTRILVMPSRAVIGKGMAYLRGVYAPIHPCAVIMGCILAE